MQSEGAGAARHWASRGHLVESPALSSLTNQFAFPSWPLLFRAPKEWSSQRKPVCLNDIGSSEYHQVYFLSLSLHLNQEHLSRSVIFQPSSSRGGVSITSENLKPSWRQEAEVFLHWPPLVCGRAGAGRQGGRKRGTEGEGWERKVKEAQS